MRRPDQCPECDSLDYTALNTDGSRYNPFNSREENMAINGHALWESCKCEDCGCVWPFRIIEVRA